MVETLKNESKFALKSLTLIGLIVLILNQFLPDLPSVQVEGIADAVLKLAGSALIIYGRWRKGGLSLNLKG